MRRVAAAFGVVSLVALIVPAQDRWRLISLTRDLDRDAARVIRARGVEVRQADLEGKARAGPGASAMVCSRSSLRGCGGDDGRPSGLQAAG